MDRIELFQNLILDFLNNYAKTKAVGYEEVETQIIADKENHHYQLVDVGWAGMEFVHHCVFHFDIKDGKIWVQKNDTELLISDYLIENGVKTNEIVAGLQPESMRKFTGFAIK